MTLEFLLFDAPSSHTLAHIPAREFSPNTLSAYGYDLKYLFTFLDREGLDWRDFRAPHMLAFLRRVPSQRPAQRLGLAVVAEGKDGPSRLPRPLDEPDLEALLSGPKRLRDLAMLLLMLDGGLRPGEVLSLHLEDISYGRRRVTIRKRDDHPHGARGKSRTERVVDLHEPRTLEAVSRYVMHERPLEATSPFVFLVGRGRQRCEPLSYDALVKLFSRKMSALGLRTPETTPHALRHTHATAMWEGGMRELSLQKRLGHASPPGLRLGGSTPAERSTSPGCKGLSGARAARFGCAATSTTGS